MIAKGILRRVLAAIIAVTAIILLTRWSLSTSDAIFKFVWRRLALDVPLSQAGGGRPDAWDQAAQTYYVVLSGAVLVATGGAAALLVLVPSGSFRARGWIYLVFLMILLPASWYNFNQGDNVLPTIYQLGLDLIIIFLGAVVALWLAKAPANAPDVRVLKTMSLALIWFGAVFAPTFFVVIWLLWWGGILSKTQAKAITWQEITEASGLASAAVAWLTYRREIEKDSPTIQIGPSV
jgi:hypothetical protein